MGCKVYHIVDSTIDSILVDCRCFPVIDLYLNTATGLPIKKDLSYNTNNDKFTYNWRKWSSTPGTRVGQIPEYSNGKFLIPYHWYRLALCKRTCCHRYPYIGRLDLCYKRLQYGPQNQLMLQYHIWSTRLCGRAGRAYGHCRDCIKAV